ncbi:hypothetical protein ARMGADRAFT_1029259 [Armillaria gallica]|uniref:Uncharacterized protein n=1 Tax=Armillaria gallica TaxID=47427 RepID=A0A2H3E5H2_ARMGA|nr:hypothetical protein ARMGADRAFT_1029259 [Armillaria gallica]
MPHNYCIKLIFTVFIGELADQYRFSHWASQASIQTKPTMKGLTSMLERLGVSNKGVSPKMTTMVILSRIGFRFDEDWLLNVGVLMATAASPETGFHLHQPFDHSLHAHASIQHLLDMDWNGTEWEFDAEWVSDIDLPNMVPDSESTAIMILRVRQWRGFTWMEEGDSDEATDIKTEELSFKNDVGMMMVQTCISEGRECGLHRANDMAGCFNYTRTPAQVREYGTVSFTTGWAQIQRTHNN